MSVLRFALLGFLLPLALPLTPARAEIFRFADPSDRGTVHEYWRLTHDRAIRDHANYHNTQCFSPDGRFVCYTHYASPEGVGMEAEGVHIIDLHTGEDISIAAGGSPRWAQQHDWLFYSVPNRAAGNPWEKGTEVWRYDAATGERDLITWGWEFLGSTDYQDRWIFGNFRRRDLPGKVFHTGRAPIVPGSEPELVFDQPAIRPLCNPSHDMLSTRSKDDGEFGASRKWMQVDGSDVRIGVPQIQGGHMAWSGDGEWMLVGNNQAQGRHWDEPFPSDMHLLSNSRFGDISPCGRSGRWICGAGGVADLRSGDGWGLPSPPSMICVPNIIGDVSDVYDCDAKGSPDGTKICFVCNYPFEEAPVTRAAATVTDETSLPVESTTGFPDSGEIVVLGEVVAYFSKTDTSFDGIERHRHGTGRYDFLKANWTVTLFQDRLMTDAERARAVAPWSWLVDAVEQAGDDEQSPLLRQRQTNVYIAVVRLPDPPHLRTVGDTTELIPGENHLETFGYYFDVDGQRVNDTPLHPGEALDLPRGGRCTAVAVEWGGLEGAPSVVAELTAGARVRALEDVPEDFSRLTLAWLVDGNEVSRDEAMQAPEAICEHQHINDGTIRREHYRQGAMVAANDLNVEGYATRRRTFHDGRMATREYWTTDDRRVGLETFGVDGSRTEQVQYETTGDGEDVERDHWYYDHGWPVRRVVKGGRSVYEKQGDEWVQTR